MVDGAARHALTILAVGDLATSTAFYKNGFGWPVTVETPVYVEFLLPGAMRLGLYQRDGFARNTGVIPTEVTPGGSSATELYFYVDDLEGRLSILMEAGAHLFSPQAPRDWGDIAAYVSDPDGNVLVVARPIL